MGDARKISRRKFFGLSAAGLAVTAGIGVYESDMVLTQRTLRLPRWKADGFRVAQISDVHVNDFAQLRAAKRAVRMAIATKPDLFVFTGDFVNYAHEEALGNIVKAFEELHDLACPGLAILGNHDYHCGAPQRVIEQAHKTPLKLLVNQTVELGDVRIVGLDDPRESHPDYVLVTAKDHPSNLVLLHEPDAVKHVTAGAGLVLSGHSHGGEMCLPGGYPLYVPRGARKYWSGYYPHAPTPLYVNRGTCTLGPGRTYCPPEVTLLTLVRA